MTIQEVAPVQSTAERMSEAVARKLRGMIAERRISGSALARMTGVSQSKMSRRLTGEYPFDIDELEAICEALGMQVEDLLHEVVRHQGLEPRTR